MELDLDAFAGLAAPDAFAFGEAVDGDHEDGVLSCGEYLMGAAAIPSGKAGGGDALERGVPRTKREVPAGRNSGHPEDDAESRRWKCGRSVRPFPLGSTLMANRDGDSPFAVQSSSC